jgi:exopolyphosphatase / guanosine-5'-triphosphate,3'-diphosphate pyrophosphatase
MLMHKQPVLAALDLGSNSFRMETGYFVGPHFQRTSYAKHILRQGDSLQPGGALGAQALQQGWECLQDFGARLRAQRVAHACAVATQTLREASNGAEFIARGSDLLGVPIQVISGAQEAHFMFRGVVGLLPPSAERRLVMDLGGRSTELALGQGTQAHQVASYPLGSALWSRRFFPEGVFTPSAFAQAYEAALQVLQPAARQFVCGSWDCAYASASMASAACEVLTANGQPADRITRQDVLWLQEQVLCCGDVQHLQLPGLRADRVPVVAGGLCVLLAVFDTLGLKAMRPAQGALRLGVLYSLKDAWY